MQGRWNREGGWEGATAPIIFTKVFTFEHSKLTMMKVLEVWILTIHNPIQSEKPFDCTEMWPEYYTLKHPSEI